LKGIENTEVEVDDVLSMTHKLIAKFNLKRCIDCGTVFVAHNNEEKYCPHCRNYEEELKRYFNLKSDSR